MNKKSVNALKRLCWAEGDIRAARELCQWMVNSPEKKTALLKRALDAGVIITYARPFGENNGLGALPVEFGKFRNSGLQKFHRRMIQARNCVAGHNDRINLNSMLSPSTPQEDPEEIQIEISANGKSAWMVTSPYLSTPVLRRIVELCLVQEGRLHKESSSIVAAASYNHGTFTLGVDFP